MDLDDARSNGRQRSRWVIPALLLAVLAVGAAAVIIFRPSKAQAPASQSQISSSTQHRTHHYRAQIEQTFIGLDSPTDVTVDTAGNLYVADPYNDRVLKLTGDPNDSIVLPFTGVQYPSRVTVDTAGNAYLVDGAFDHRRVLRIPAGEQTPTVLPFADLGNVLNLAVDKDGAVLVSDMDHKRVMKLAPSSNAPAVLPFNDLEFPQGVAADDAGNVYVVDAVNHSRVLKLPAGSSTPIVLPMDGLRSAMGVTVSAGDVYVADEFNHRVLRFAAGAGTPMVLPFTGLYLPTHVAVDPSGNVYVITSVAGERDAGKVLELPLA